MEARHRVEPPRSILVLKPSSFGDIVHTLPAVALLRQRWPDCRISWLVNTEWCPLLDGSPVVDRIVPFPRKLFCGWRGMLELPRWLQKSFATENYDLVLDYQGLLRTALLGRYARGKHFLGLGDAREGAAWFYDQAISVPTGVPHAVERYLALSWAAVGSGTENSTAPQQMENTQFLFPEGEDSRNADALQKGFVLLHPFARGRDKSLSTAQVHTLCACLSPRQVVLVGTGPDEELSLPNQCLNLLNSTTLPQLIRLIRRAGFVISVDSGPAHVAAALAKPMIAIHTWSDPRRVGPYLPTAWVWKSGELLRFRELASKDDAFFAAPPTPITPAQLETICRMATSS